MGVCAHCSVQRYEGDTEGTDLVSHSAPSCVRVLSCGALLHVQLSFVEEYEGDVQDIFIGLWDGVWQGVWSLAEQCVHDSRHKRPTSTEVRLIGQ